MPPKLAVLDGTQKRGPNLCCNSTQDVLFFLWALHERQAVGYTTRKGVLLMRITLHIGRFTVTIIVKSRNRHSAK